LNYCEQQKAFIMMQHLLTKVRTSMAANTQYYYQYTSVVSFVFNSSCKLSLRAVLLQHKHTVTAAAAAAAYTQQCCMRVHTCMCVYAYYSIWQLQQ
jgi:hypothetical protein